MLTAKPVNVKTTMPLNSLDWSRRSRKFSSDVPGITPPWKALRASVVLMVTRRSESATGKGFSSTALTTVKMVVFAPMPIASVRTATAVKPGFFANMRRP